MSNMCMMRPKIAAALSPDPSFTGPGANAPTWAGATSLEKDFATPIPAYPEPGVDGFRGEQGFGEALGDGFTRVSYPTVSTPTGTKAVLRITYPGVQTTFSGSGQVTDAWDYRGTTVDTEYTDAAISIAGTWVGTIIFERSDDGGGTWEAVEGEGVHQAGGYTSASGTSITHSGGSQRELYRFYDTGGVVMKVRARVTAWTSGVATVTVGMRGGQSPARGGFGTIPAGRSKLYVRTIARASANWSDNGNTGTKAWFFRFPAGNSNHYLGFSSGEDQDIRPRLALQGHSFDAVDSAVGFPFGTWLDTEVELLMNTPGVEDGIGRVWVNGALVVEKTDFMFAEDDDTPEWEYLRLDPTYGGGSNPPVGNFMDISSIYIRSAP